PGTTPIPSGFGASHTFGRSSVGSLILAQPASTRLRRFSPAATRLSIAGNIFLSAVSKPATTSSVTSNSRGCNTHLLPGTTGPSEECTLVAKLGRMVIVVLMDT